MAERPQIKKENVKSLFESPYLRVADLQYAPGKHYYDATRRTMENLTAVKSDEEFQSMLADAVSCFVILDGEGEEPRLLLSYEFRYPAGQYLLSVPAGLIDEEDRDKPDALITTAIREIKEETGLAIQDTDSVRIVNPLVFSTPGLTDESNALVCAVLRSARLSDLSQEGAVGSEQFDGFCLLTKSQAREVLGTGRDERGKYYPLYTWAALLYFVSDMWRQ
ncbi:MAG: NUDIX hydrolase [Lachnospiraceae bacterium]|nr:NUDIX hydrolase [uncultured Acetatifactor sp.]MCI8543990.1 NUDIX hydrolase [Lachnospiraceae bacterium]